MHHWWLVANIPEIVAKASQNLFAAILKLVSTTLYFCKVIVCYLLILRKWQTDFETAAKIFRDDFVIVCHAPVMF
jgi:hypothetical protein